MSQGSDLIALARSKAGQWYYTNDEWARFHPEESGGTDCSGFARWCYLQFGEDIGWWTGNESQAGYEIARGHYAWEIPWDDLQPGDLILMTTKYWNLWDFSEYLCHIELYCGGGTMIGHPGGYGPQEKWAQAWMESYGCITWMVRRVFGDDDMEAHDVWEYDWNGTAPNGNMYNCAVATNKAVTGFGISSWGYRDNENGPDAWAILNETHKQVKALADGGGVEIDYDRLAAAVADGIADAVADKLAARLKD